MERKIIVKEKDLTEDEEEAFDLFLFALHCGCEKEANRYIV